MSILIKGMEMPESCMSCPFSNSINFGAVCCPTHTIIPDSKLFNDVGEPLDRQSWCPLIEVPPHGDLIDRSKLYEKTAEWEAQALHMVGKTVNDEDTTEWRKWSTILTERSAFKFDVADAPTVIPADKGGET